MENFNPDDRLKTDAKRENENEEEDDFKATKTEIRSTTKFTVTLLLLATQKVLPKADKETIRKRSKKFEVVDGILDYKEKKGNSMNLRQV